jgi:hypothetical protein
MTDNELPICLICHQTTLSKSNNNNWIDLSYSLCCHSPCHIDCLKKYNNNHLENRCLICRTRYPKPTVFFSGQYNKTDVEILLVNYLKQLNNKTILLPLYQTNHNNLVKCYHKSLNINDILSGKGQCDCLLHINRCLTETIIDKQDDSIKKSDILVAIFSSENIDNNILVNIKTAYQQKKRIYLIFKSYYNFYQYRQFVLYSVWSLSNVDTITKKNDFVLIDILRDYYQSYHNYLIITNYIIDNDKKLYYLDIMKNKIKIHNTKTFLLL